MTLFYWEVIKTVNTAYKVNVYGLNEQDAIYNAIHDNIENEKITNYTISIDYCHCIVKE